MTRWTNLKVWIEFRSHIRALAFEKFHFGNSKSVINNGRPIFTTICSVRVICIVFYSAQEILQWSSSVYTTTNETSFSISFPLCISIFLFPFLKYKNAISLLVYEFQRNHKNVILHVIKPCHLIHYIFIFGYHNIIFILKHRYINT